MSIRTSNIFDPKPTTWALKNKCDNLVGNCKWLAFWKGCITKRPASNKLVPALSLFHYKVYQSLPLLADRLEAPFWSRDNILCTRHPGHVWMVENMHLAHLPVAYHVTKYTHRCRNRGVIFGEGVREYGFAPPNIWHHLGKIVPKYHGLSQSFVQNLTASRGFATWTPIKI